VKYGRGLMNFSPSQSSYTLFPLGLSYSLNKNGSFVFMVILEIISMKKYKFLDQNGNVQMFVKLICSCVIDESL
jgi:hypothetical protein